MTVSMMDDQLQVLIATMWGITDRDQKMNLLRSWAGAEQWEVAMKTQHKLDIEATREGDEEVPTHTYEQVVESKEPTLHKLDQVWPGTREGEVAAQAHTYKQVVESTELTLHELDQVWPGTREGEVAVQAHTYEQVVESTELTQLKLDTEATREVEMNKIRVKLDRM